MFEYKKLIKKILLNIFCLTAPLSAMEQPEKDYSIIIRNETRQKLELTFIHEISGMNWWKETEYIKAGSTYTTVLDVSKGVKWPIKIYLYSLKGDQILILNTVTLKGDDKLLIDKAEADKHWVYRYEDSGNPEIIIYLRKLGDENSIAAYTASGNKAFLERKEKKKETKKLWEKQAQVALSNLRNSLEIEYPIQETIFDLGKNKKFSEINDVIQKEQKPEVLKNLILLQLNLALFIANRVDFHQGLELHASQYPKQTLITNLPKGEKRKVQWLYLLLESKQKLKNMTTIESFQEPLMFIHEFLGDIGYIKHNPRFVESLQEPTQQDIKNALSENFRLLFEHLFVVTSVKGSPYLDMLKERMGLPKK